MEKLNIDTEYRLLVEGRLNLMNLPAGAIAWLFDRPKNQIDTAEFLGVEALDRSPIINARLLRDDLNVLILYCEHGPRFSVYPDGGIGHNGKSISRDEAIRMMDDGYPEEKFVDPCSQHKTEPNVVMEPDIFNISSIPEINSKGDFYK